VVDSKINAKKYFLPLYVVFLITTPTLITILSGLLKLSEGEGFFMLFQYINWGRVISYFLLFGLIWPLTLVISPIFVLSIERNTGYSFLDAITHRGFAANQALGGYIIFFFAWIVPVIASIYIIYLHKKDVSKQIDDPEKFGWIDYLAAFI